ncbi:MAG: hypothetical protein AAF889_01500 [Cyanobacteria bacterium P01_D01_bin.73]
MSWLIVPAELVLRAVGAIAPPRNRQDHSVKSESEGEPSRIASSQRSRWSQRKDAMALGQGKQFALVAKL